ncbi:tapasin-related protein-like [Eucyclogobius newberryi]|uniref:tapasin-related protein-like n=1 Tax=Eucyclogobius newberryi TaxID=166745 RepID=UPI003B59A23E
MGFILKILVYASLFTGVLWAYQIPWLPCKFIDETVFYNDQGHVETKHIHREAMLQFGHKEDAPVNPNAVTFLITSSKLDVRKFVEGAETEQLSCEVQRYSTEGIHMRWPVRGEHEYNRWFTCRITDPKNQLTVLGFIRQSTAEPPTGEHDYRNWTAIEDRATLPTTVVMVMKSQTPKIKASLGSTQKLDCHFAVDHKAPNVVVEWHKRGERTSLFNHSAHTGVSQGSGVSTKKLSSGDASYSIPLSKMSSEGTYMCSVTVLPLHWSLEISLQIEAAPRVSLNTGPSLSLTEGDEKKVVCEADNYYPLDVDIQWTQQDAADVGRRVGAPLPKVLDNVLYSSHKPNPDRTLSLSAFFYLKAKLSDSGRQFTCTVSHQSLRVPIKKRFTLTVQEPSNLMAIALSLAVIALVIGVLLLLRSVLNGRRRHQW